MSQQWYTVFKGDFIVLQCLRPHSPKPSVGMPEDMPTHGSLLIKSWPHSQTHAHGRGWPKLCSECHNTRWHRCLTFTTSTFAVHRYSTEKIVWLDRQSVSPGTPQPKAISVRTWHCHFLYIRGQDGVVRHGWIIFRFVTVVPTVTESAMTELASQKERMW